MCVRAREQQNYETRAPSEGHASAIHRCNGRKQPTLSLSCRKNVLKDATNSRSLQRVGKVKERRERGTAEVVGAGVVIIQRRAIVETLEAADDQMTGKGAAQLLTAFTIQRRHV